MRPTVFFFLRRLILPALAVNLVLTSAAPRTGQMTLWFASGHTHVFFQRGSQPEHLHAHGVFHAHDVVHVHASDASLSVTDVSFSDPHRHACVEVGLPGADLRPSLKPQGDRLLALMGVPSVPLVSPVAAGPAIPCLHLASPSALGVPPPELLRCTILLI